GARGERASLDRSFRVHRGAADVPGVVAGGARVAGVGVPDGEFGAVVDGLGVVAVDEGVDPVASRGHGDLAEPVFGVGRGDDPGFFAGGEVGADDALLVQVEEEVRGGQRQRVGRGGGGGGAAEHLVAGGGVHDRGGLRPGHGQPGAVGG